jgi:CRISPR-associated protein Csb2
MFALRVTYLTGRVYSAAFDDGDDKAEPEWPPHPSRLFSALVSAWGDGGAEEELRPALEWLENQEAPEIHAGSCTVRKLVKPFVPVNDSRTLPEDRPRKPRAFPSATLSHPDVYFIWRTQPPESVRSALDQILNRTSSLGHSSSLVAVEMADGIPAGPWTAWHPDAPSGTRLRIAYPDRLKDLIKRYERFQKDPNKIHRPSLGRTTLYDEPAEAREEAPQGVFDRMIILRRDEGPRASLRSALSVVAALRGAMLALAPQPIPEFVSGHAAESTDENPVRSVRSHVALAALPFAGALHATGDLLGVAVLLPKMLTEEERTICWGIASEIKELRMPWGLWKVSVTDAEEQRRAILPETWTRPCNAWSTVTPFVFDRYPKDPYGQEAEQIVRDAFLRVGLPEPKSIDLPITPGRSEFPKLRHFRQCMPGRASHSGTTFTSAYCLIGPLPVP